MSLEDNLIGQRLGQYEIVALLGKGGMATVYRARQTSVNRDVAIKVIKPELTAASEFLTRFEREAQTVASFSHPHILKVFDYGQHEGLVYLVMELMTGGSLSDLLSKGPIAPKITGGLLAQMAQALDYAHQQGVVHRDLKPQNVLLDGSGNAFLTDFGIAKLMQSNTALTQSGTAMGTPLYMSPEQWQDDHVDSRTDIYALGVMLFEMLTGAVPFDATTPYGIMYKHIYEAPPPIRNLPPEISQPVDQVISKAVAKNRDQRFQSATALTVAFRTALSGKKLVESGTTLTARPATNNLWIVGAVAAVLLVALIGFALKSNAATPSARTAGAPTFANSTSAPVALAATIDPSPTLKPTVKITHSIDIATESVAELSTTIPTAIPATLRAGLAGLSLTATAGAARRIPIIRTGGPLVAPPANDRPLRPGGNTGAPSDSPASNGQIALVSSDSSGKIGIFVVNSNGTSMHRVSDSIGGDYSPVWSPDHQYIAFSSTRDGKANLYAMTAEGKNVHRITNDASNELMPTWSPDGKNLAFVSDRDGNPEIYTVSVTGQDMHRLTTNKTKEFAPAWSPDGRWIAFTSDRGGSPDLYLIGTDGANEHRVAHSGGIIGNPAWSPDGKQLAYSERNGLFVIPADSTGQGARRVVTVSGEVTESAWSPDGKQIAFAANMGPKHLIFIVDLDGQNMRSLLADGANGGQPSW
ncbi:MAG: protein kinase [Chloroflexota bacterium]